jgi:aromatic ring hydroxylase
MRTPEQYRAKLAQMRPNLYIGGEKVGRDDPRIVPGVNVMAVTFEIAQDPKWKGVATATSAYTGKEINRWAHTPQHPFDLMQKQKMIRLGAQRVGGCIQRCMGHDAITALSICTKEIDDKYGTEYNKRFVDWLSWYQDNDYCAACAQTDMKGDRTKRPSEQVEPGQYVHVDEVTDEGIYVSGCKVCITMAAYADEILVIPTRAMMEGDADWAVAFAIPGDDPGIKQIVRPVWLHERKEIQAPFCEFGVSDSMIIFDHTFIPKERVFMCREWEFGRRMAMLFADSHRHSYCGCKPAVSDVILGATLLAAEANNIQKVSHVREKMSEYALGSELAFAAGVAAAMYGEKTSSGTFFPNAIFANVGRRLMGENIYHEYNMLTEIAGGLSVTMPFEEDFMNPETKPYMDKYIVRNPKLSAEESHRIWRFVENVSASAMTSWYQIAGVHGGGSPIMETIALNIDFDYEARRKVARYLAGIDKELDQSTGLIEQPTFGCNLMQPEPFGDI